MYRIPCKKCGSKALASTIEKTNGLCMLCFKAPNRKPIWERVEEVSARLYGNRDMWHTNLPNVKQIEELDSQNEPVKQCDCCNYLTLSKKGIGERCGVCAWVDEMGLSDNLNEDLTLAQARENFKEQGVCHDKYFMKTRPVRYKEMLPEHDTVIDRSAITDEVEMATEENGNRVFKAYTRIMEAVHAQKNITHEEDLVFQIELLSQEANSGASFEQYFRWVGKKEVDNILGHLKMLDIPEAYEIVQEAIMVAFPNGVPEDEGEYEKCTDWNENQEKRLEAQFKKFEKYNGIITNKLGIYIEKYDIK